MAMMKEHLEEGSQTGKQNIKSLIRQDQGAISMDVDKTDLRGFQKYARKYGIDYAIVKDKSVSPPKYLVFFKGKDKDAMQAAFDAYAADVMTRNQKPSVIKTLHKLLENVRVLPGKTLDQDRQRNRSR